MAEVTVYNYQAIEERRWLRSLVPPEERGSQIVRVEHMYVNEVVGHHWKRAKAPPSCVRRSLNGKS